MTRAGSVAGGPPGGSVGFADDVFVRLSTPAQVRDNVPFHIFRIANAEALIGIAYDPIQTFPVETLR